MSPMRLVLVEWVDSLGCSSEWQRIKVHNPRPLRCRSVGWLLHDGEDCKVIIPHMSSEDQPEIDPQGCGDMTIPSQSILTIKDIQA